MHRRYWTRSRKEALAAWLFILPDFIGLLIFVAVPMVLALSLGFFNVDGFGGYKFIGLANYNRMLHDPLFLKSIGVTIVYVVCLVPGLYVTGLGLAILVRQKNSSDRDVAKPLLHALRRQSCRRGLDLEGDAPRQGRVH